LWQTISPKKIKYSSLRHPALRSDWVRAGILGYGCRCEWFIAIVERHEGFTCFHTTHHVTEFGSETVTCS
jgi:hypothetical protein